MNYLVTTNKGNIYTIEGDKIQLLLKDSTPSLYTNDHSIRFIKKFNDGYLIGKSEYIGIETSKGGMLKLPGLVDIKDVAIGGNFIAILSGLRDSVYILSRDEIHTCFNIGKNGNLEFFRERQVQCKEIASNYCQIFYCPAMDNFHNFTRLKLEDNNLRLISKINGCKLVNSYVINLNDFSIKQEDYDIEKDLLNLNIPSIQLEDEIITDFVECS